MYGAQYTVLAEYVKNFLHFILKKTLKACSNAVCRAKKTVPAGTLQILSYCTYTRTHTRAHIEPLKDHAYTHAR